ncbi:Oxygen regulatory protein NreC [Neomoorella glycerini]|uniref:Stage 0 sporulation protein A homolog n=1 Tax=Neomoorella glycerini TaxID=55779 RepID=A0A6I5ZVQ7_9FIRM|nr:response regulator transcription factor [Moorella glycerini]QGP93944.1 Oxygen regulatory protein NreC [Moorella glycerini]
MDKINVIIVDDHPLVRDGLLGIINAQSDMEVIGEAGQAGEALEIAKRLKPQVMVLDISLPDFNGLEVAYQLKVARENDGWQTQVVILSMYSNEKFVFRALDAGALGYVHKNSPGREIVEAIRSVTRGKYFLSSDISSTLISEYLKQCRNQRAEPSYERLTHREQEIFRLVVEGVSNRDIARLLTISKKTVEKHRANIMRKLGAHNYAELVKHAIKIGILDTDI